MGTATRDEVDEEVVVLDLDDEVEAFREMETPPVEGGKRGKEVYGGVEGEDADGVGTGEGWMVVAIVSFRIEVVRLGSNVSQPNAQCQAATSKASSSIQIGQLWIGLPFGLLHRGMRVGRVVNEGSCDQAIR